jgi:cell migration-inducing and hyaluronan-binding protein
MRLGRHTIIPVITIVIALVMVACQQPTITPPPGVSGLWSDPELWGGALPQAGDIVTIPVGTTVTLDTDTPALAGLMIEGTLRFDDREVELISSHIMVWGRLEIGSASAPYRHHATITLTGPQRDDMGLATKGLAVMGEGQLELHGEPREGWTRLDATAAAGADSITLERAMDWRAGDRIVIASTDFDYEQAEERTVVAVDGATLTLDAPLEVEHWGERQTFAGQTLDERAEVALLSRNIVIRGDDGSVSDGFGGHIIVLEAGSAHVSGVELTRMGQRGVLARYPFHWHLAGDRSGDYFVNSSVHHNFSRCVTVHGTHNVEVEGIVGFETFGHCFFLEDGIETGNTFESNLGLSIRAPEEADALLPTDHSFQGPAVYWITNPDNRYLDNVAAGSPGSGFWLALPEHPTGPSATDEVFPRRTPLDAFVGNVAHSQGGDGLHVDRGPSEGSLASESTNYTPLSDPEDPESEGLWADFEAFTAYKNRGNAVWLRGRWHRVTGGIFADNAVGVTMASRDSEVVDSLFIGESANLGTPRPWERVGLDGRSLPRPWDCDNCVDMTIRGFELYDGTVWASGNTFTEFVPNALRSAAAVSQLDYTDFVVSPRNYVEGSTVTTESNAVYFEDRPLPSDAAAGEDGYRSTVFEDRDGSLTGAAGTMIVVDNPFLTTDACSFVAAWNAWTCPERYVRLALDVVQGSALGPVTLSRDGGPDHTMLGTPNALGHYSTSTLEGGSYTYGFGGATPDRMRILLWHGVSGDSVVVSLPYPHADVALYRDWWIDERNRLLEAVDLDDLTAGGSSYLLEGGVLTLRLEVQPDRPWAVIDLCRHAGCP